MPPREINFVVRSAPLKGLEYNLRKDVIKIGRTAENDVILDQTSVSRSHAVIRQDAGRLILEDAGSANKVKLNGKTVSKAFLPEQCVVTIGDVEILVKCLPDLPVVASPASAPAANAIVSAASESETAQTVRPMPSDAASASEPVSDPGNAAGNGAQPPKPKARKILYAAVAAFCVFLLALFFAMSRDDVGEEVIVRNIPVAMKAGQERAVWVDQYRAVADNSDKAVATAEFDPWWPGMLKVSGLSEGEAILTLKSPAGGVETCRMFVSVRGRVEDDLVARYGPKLTDAQRREISARLKSEGDSALALSPWESFRKYRDAVAILEPVSPKPKEYVEANNAMTPTSEAWQKRYRDLYVQYYAAWNTRDYRLAIQRLREIAQFFNDPEDFRHQAAMRMAESIQSELAAEKRRRGY